MLQIEIFVAEPVQPSEKGRGQPEVCSVISLYSDVWWGGMSKFDGMEDKLEEVSRLLKAMASPNRLMILCLLAEGEKSVGELTSELGLRQATVSQHLARLRLDCLVETRRDAQTIYYRISDSTAEEIMQVLYNAYCAKLGEEPPVAGLEKTLT